MQYLQADISEGESIWTGPVCCVETMAEAEQMTAAQLVQDWELSLDVPDFTTPEAWEESGTWSKLLTDYVDSASFLQLDPFRALVELDLVDFSAIPAAIMADAIRDRSPIALTIAFPACADKADRIEAAMGAAGYDNLSDLLADARHYCDREGTAYHVADRDAQDHYTAERVEADRRAKEEGAQ